MIAWVALRLFKWAVPGWAKPLLDVAGIALVLAGAWWAFASHYQAVGGAAVTAKVEREHTARVVEARTDERAIAATGRIIAARVARTDVATTEFVKSKLKDIADASETNAAAPVAAGADATVFDGLAMRSSVNAVVDRANRAADSADARP